MATELDQHPQKRPTLGFGVDYFQDILERQRLKIQPITGVIVGRHCLGIAVDHDGFETGIPQRKGGVDARIIKLDTLTNSVGTRTQDDHFRGIGGANLGFLVVA